MGSIPSMSTRRRATFPAAIMLAAGLLPAQPGGPPAAVAAPVEYEVIAVDASDMHTCAIRPDGTLACWGDNEYGESIPPAGTFTSVSAGGWDTCAIRPDGSAACWGFDENGETKPPEGPFAEVSVGVMHACGLRIDGTIVCWGNDTAGETKPPAGTFTHVAAGAYFTCAVRADGTVACWGDDEAGQAQAPGGTFTTISAGAYVACGTRTDGSIACWGDDSYGLRLPPAGSFMAVGVGVLLACGIRTDGTLACWGNGDVGRTTAPSGTFTSLAVGSAHACAIRTGGTLTCWGGYADGQATPRPSAAMRSLPRWTVGAAVTVAWSARPAFSPVAAYDVRYVRARWNGPFGDWTTWRAGTPEQSRTFTGSPGSTYCFSARARDADGLVSTWSERTCTAIPLDDASLRHTTGWTVLAGSRFYRSTAMRTSVAGARIIRTGVEARRIAIVATTCPGCGTVRVYLGSRLLRTISLDAATRTDRRVIPVKLWYGIHKGTLTIRVASSGRRVIIDGLGVSRVAW
jgi:Regulator of chromosome condensation (RCC1) repeat